MRLGRLPSYSVVSLPVARCVAQGYWSKNRNRFDGVITLGGVFTELVSSTPPLVGYLYIFRLFAGATVLVNTFSLALIAYRGCDHEFCLAP